jgi:phospholipase C
VPSYDVSRRDLLRAGAALGLGVASLPLLGALPLETPSLWAAASPRPKPLRKPGSLPNPKLPEGTDTLPQIEHILVVMMENHSFDNYLGMLGRGDGLHRDRKGRPTNTNPDGTGNLIRSFRMPSTCQLSAVPRQDWVSSHTSLQGANQGFVKACSPVAMGYWTGDDIPFYYGLAKAFPVCDRWFGSCLAQTYPNRRFLIAGTAAGIVNTTIDSITKAEAPPNGSIFERLDAHGITWRNYFTDVPGVAILPKLLQDGADNIVKVDQYFTDAAAGTLPGFAIIDPNFDHGSEENSADIRPGEEFVSRVINAAMQGPAWEKTLIIWCYDEHGGYYDHVVPPKAIKPDDIPPSLDPSLVGDGYGRYGFRVPAVIVSPYARKKYVSHVVHDHTSILKLVETKWNLPALTYRDANADNLLDSLDLKGKPAFREPPTLPKPALAAPSPPACTPGSPGVIPPPESVIKATASSAATSTSH